MEYRSMITYDQLTFVQQTMVDDGSYTHDASHPYNHNEVVSQEYYDTWHKKFEKWESLRSIYTESKKQKLNSDNIKLWDSCQVLNELKYMKIIELPGNDYAIYCTDAECLVFKGSLEECKEKLPVEEEYYEAFNQEVLIQEQREEEYYKMKNEEREEWENYYWNEVIGYEENSQNDNAIEKIEERKLEIELMVAEHSLYSPEEMGGLKPIGVDDGGMPVFYSSEANKESQRTKTPLFLDNSSIDVRTFKGEIDKEFTKIYIIQDSNLEQFYTYDINIDNIKESRWKHLPLYKFERVKELLSEAGVPIKDIKENDYKEIYNELLNLRNSADVLEFVKTQSFLITCGLLQYIDQQSGVPNNDTTVDYDYIDLDDPESFCEEHEWKGFIRDTVKNEVEFKTDFDIKETDPNHKKPITWRAEQGDPDYTNECIETTLEDIDDGLFGGNYPPGMSAEDLQHVGELERGIAKDILNESKTEKDDNHKKGLRI